MVLALLVREEPVPVPSLTPQLVIARTLVWVMVFGCGLTWSSIPHPSPRGDEAAGGLSRQARRPSPR